MNQHTFHKKALIIGLLSIVLCIPIQTISGTTLNPTSRDDTILYVDDDNTQGPWDGTPEHPYQTIQDALLYATSGDTVYVFSGQYYSSMSYGLISIGLDITLLGENPETTIITGGGAYGEKWVIGIGSDEGTPTISNFRKPLTI